MKTHVQATTTLSLSMLLAAGLLFTADSAVAEAAAEAPVADTTPQGYAASFLRDFDRVSLKYLQLAEAIPEEKYGWRPTPEVRSVSEVFVHVAQANGFLSRTAAGIEAKTALGEDAEQTITKKAEVLAVLEASQELFRQAVAKRGGDFEEEVRFFWGPAPVRDVFIQMTAHVHEHLGQMTAYSRMLGVVPPWSRSRDDG